MIDGWVLPYQSADLQIRLHMRPTIGRSAQSITVTCGNGDALPAIRAVAGAERAGKAGTGLAEW